jgi:hypothetical protein
VLTGLDCLPLEIVDCILASFERLEDLFRLGLALPHMWPLVRRHMEARHFMPHLGRWAGTNLICLGEHPPTACSPSLYPPGLLTEADLKELEHGLSRAECARSNINDDNESDDRSRKAPACLHQVATARYSSPVDQLSNPLRPTYLQIGLGEMHRRDNLARAKGQAHRAWGQPWHIHFHRMCEDLRHYERRDFYPLDREWVLRSLTAQEVVRADTLARPNWVPRRAGAAPAFVKGGINFGSVVLMRTSWSVEDAKPDSDGFDLGNRRGVWAGHCLEITTAQRHEEHLMRMEAGKRAQWRDVSDEVAVEMKRLWDRYHPNDPYDRPGLK